MLDSSTLAQLKILKTDIHNSIPRYTGEVKGTQGRYGFAVTDKGDAFFLSPDEMDKVLPGDTIAFKVEEAKNGKKQAIIEKLLESQVNELWGTYQIRGKGHFIAPDDNQLNRWIFIPPKQRKGAKPGQLIHAKLTQHPYPSGRSQAEIIRIIGCPEDAQVEQKFMISKYGIESEFSSQSNQQVDNLCNEHKTLNSENRLDLSHLPFITIDSPSTRDIDDALLVEAQTQGWRLWIAIADPAAFIQEGTDLDKEAAKRATSVYMPDLNIPMLPRALSENLCSLSEDNLRYAMVVELQVTDSGDIESTQIHNALIKSQARLSYHQVSELINQGSSGDISPSLQGHVMHLDACSKALREYRQNHCIIMDEKRDYKLITGENGKVIDICKLERSAAHQVVEECMLACNRSVAQWLAQSDNGIYITNAGVRTERQGDVASLLKEILGLESKLKFSKLTLKEYLDLFKGAQEKSTQFDIPKMLSRQMDRSLLNTQAQPHSGLGFEQYTTFTSPLRRYNDLLVHRIIKRRLAQENNSPISQETLDKLQQRQNNARMASMQAEQWLKLDWFAKQPADKSYNAQIFQLMSHGLRVKLVDYGIDGYVDLDKNQKWQLDTVHMVLSNDSHTFNLNGEITVCVDKIDVGKRNLLFKLA